MTPLAGPLVRPLVCAIADGGMPWESSGSVATAAYSPLTDAANDLRSLWIVDSVSLSGSLIDAFVDLKAGYALTSSGSLRATSDATTIVDIDGGTHAGAVFAGAQGYRCNDAAFSAMMASIASHTVVVAGQQGNGIIGCLAEYGTNSAATAGRWSCWGNDANHGALEALARSASGTGTWSSRQDSFPWIDPSVATFEGVGLTSSGVQSIARDGVAMLGNAVNSGFTPGSNWGSDTLYVGSRNMGAAYALTAKIHAIAICGPSCTGDALYRLRTWLGARIGAPQA